MLRRTSVVQVVDELARAQWRDRAREDLLALLVGVAWAIWSFRVEIALAVAVAAVQRTVAGRLGALGGWVAAALAVAVVLAVPTARRFVWRLLRAMRVRRAWA